jgi:hypothetical protein
MPLQRTLVIKACFGPVEAIVARRISTNPPKSVAANKNRRSPGSRLSLYARLCSAEKLLPARMCDNSLAVAAVDFLQLAD